MSMSLGRRIFHRRSFRGLSATELAKRIGIGYWDFIRIEHDRKPCPPVSVIADIAREVDCHPAEICIGSGGSVSLSPTIHPDYLATSSFLDRVAMQAAGYCPIVSRSDFEGTRRQFFEESSVSLVLESSNLSHVPGLHDCGNPYPWSYAFPLYEWAESQLDRRFTEFEIEAYRLLYRDGFPVKAALKRMNCGEPTFRLWTRSARYYVWDLIRSDEGRLIAMGLFPKVARSWPHVNDGLPVRRGKDVRVSRHDPQCGPCPHRS